MKMHEDLHSFVVSYSLMLFPFIPLLIVATIVPQCSHFIPFATFDDFSFAFSIESLFFINNFAMSSKLRPFVSGTTVTTNKTANAQNIEYIQNVPAVVISYSSRINSQKNVSHKYLLVYKLIGEKNGRNNVTNAISPKGSIPQKKIKHILYEKFSKRKTEENE